MEATLKGWRGYEITMSQHFNEAPAKEYRPVSLRSTTLDAFI